MLTHISRRLAHQSHRKSIEEMPKLEVFRSLRLREHNATPSHDDNFPLLKSRSCVRKAVHHKWSLGNSLRSIINIYSN